VEVLLKGAAVLLTEVLWFEHQKRSTNTFIYHFSLFSSHNYEFYLYISLKRSLFFCLYFPECSLKIENILRKGEVCSSILS